MKFSFSTLLGTVPRRARTALEVANAEVSIKKEDRKALKTADLLRLASSAREGGKEKFIFFKANGQLGSDFKAVYDLQMRIYALSKTLSFYDMHAVFQVTPAQALDQLQTQLSIVFECQEALALCDTYLQTDPSSATLIQDKDAATILSSKAVVDLNSIEIFTLELLKYFKIIDVAKIRRSNAYYAQYGAGHTVENLS